MRRAARFAPRATARLSLRPVVMADAAATLALMTPAVSRGLGSWPQPSNLDMVADRIRDDQALARRGDAVSVALVRSADQALLGWLGVHREPTVPRLASLGYFVGEAFQRQGYVAEAAAVILPWALDALGLEAIEAAAQLDNAGSIAVMRKLGMARIGVRPVFASARGRAEVCVIHAYRRPT